MNESCKTRLIPATEWNQHHPWPPLGGLRYLIFHARSNGCDSAVHRVGATRPRRRASVFRMGRQSEGTLMTQRYFTDEEILRAAELLGPVKFWPPGMEALQGIAAEYEKRRSRLWAAFWLDGAVCVLAAPRTQNAPCAE
jgi:hypothetical protein